MRGESSEDLNITVLPAARGKRMPRIARMMGAFLVKSACVCRLVFRAAPGKHS